jgi:hypothetical protein
MRDYENPIYVPRLPLKIIACAYILWFVVVPSVVLIRSGQLQGLPVFIAGGLTLTGMGLGALFVHRLILWFHYTFFWYITAAFAVGSGLCAGSIAVGLFTLPPIPSVPLSPTLQAIVQTLIIPGAIVGIVILVLVFRPRPRPAAPQPVAPAPVPTATPAPVDPAAAIRERRRKLGLDK